MLLFRDEEHVDRWCAQWSLQPGAMLTLEIAWALAQAWYGVPRNRAEWRRYTAEETEAVFHGLDLTGPFWAPRG